MISGKENIIRWVEQNDAPFWKIYPHGSARNNYLASYESNNSMKESLEKLAVTLDMLSGGRYVICAKEKADQTKGYFETAFENQNASNSAVSGNGLTPQIDGIGQAFEMRLTSEISKLKTEFKMELLEKENQELKLKVKELEASGLESTFNNVLKRIDPFIDPALDHFFPIEKTARVAAVGFNQTKKIEQMSKNAPASTEQEASERAKVALQTWADKDPDRFLAVVEKIADTVSTDFGTYDMYIKMLLK